jgi:hypothetical protein
MVDGKKAALTELGNLITRLEDRMKHKTPSPRPGQPQIVVADTGKVLEIIKKAHAAVSAVT